MMSWRKGASASHPVTPSSAQETLQHLLKHPVTRQHVSLEKPAPCLPVSSAQPLGTICLPPPPTITSCTSSGDANSTLSIIDILPLRYFPNPQRHFCSTPNQSSCPPHFPGISMRLDSCCPPSRLLSPGLGRTSRRTWGDAHLCGEGMAQKPPVREGRRIN